MCKLWPYPEDVDEEITMMLSVQHETSIPGYIYDVVKLLFRSKTKSKRQKVITLLTMPGEESPRRPGAILTEKARTTDFLAPISEQGYLLGNKILAHNSLLTEKKQ